MTDAPRTLIIGAKGRMGSMLLERGRTKGLALEGVDQPLNAETIAKKARHCEMVLLAVPVLVLDEVLEKVCAYLPKSALLTDITSVKERPMQCMERHWKGVVVGTHPLFGPTPNEEDPLPVAIVAGKKATEKDLLHVEQFFETLGFQTFRCAAKEHDRAMACIQNLNFITNLAYFALLSGHENLLPFVTPSFQRRLTAAQKMLTEDAPMFMGLFENNLHSHRLVREFGKMLNLAASGDLDLLCQRAQWWWRK